MNTPKPCDTCSLLYSNVLTEDDPNASAECKMGRILGDVTCPYRGKDNNGRPKADYILGLRELSDEQLFKEMKDKIWASAYASNNPRSDYHWQCDATYDEGKRREKPDLYAQAHREVSEKS
jgi:hypothetical protein